MRKDNRSTIVPKRKQGEREKRRKGENEKQRNVKLPVSPSPPLRFSSHFLIPLALIIITFIVYSGVLSADFLDWDDPTFVLGNKNITSLSWAHIANMFSTFCMGNYCPLTILSYAVD